MVGKCLMSIGELFVCKSERLVVYVADADADADLDPRRVGNAVA